MPGPKKQVGVTLGGASKADHAALTRRIEKEAKQAATQRRSSLAGFQKQWTAGVAGVLEKTMGIVPAELEGDLRMYLDASDEKERSGIAQTLADRYGKVIDASRAGMGGLLPPPALTPLMGTLASGPCPISTADALAILLCGALGVCACPPQRATNPGIFNTGRFSGFAGSADPVAGTLEARDRWALVGAPHTFAGLQGSFTVPAAATSVRVFLPVDVGHSTVTLAGVGYAHGWVTLRLRVVGQIDAARDLVNCEQELQNHWSWLGGFDTHHHRPASAPVGLVGCFTRAPTAAPQSFLFSVELSLFGTVIGFAGVQTSASARVLSMLVMAC